MYKVTIRPHWEITQESGAPMDTAVVLRLLLSIQETGSIAKAAEAVRLSYRHAWGLLREVEQLFGDALVSKGRGRGTALTPLAQRLIWADRRIAARLSPTLQSLSSELEEELNKAAEGKARTIRLHASHGFAVAALLNHINEAGLPLELRYRNSTDAVAALYRRECDLAGFHVPLGKFERQAVELFKPWLDPKAHCLMQLAVRNQGLFVAPGNPLGVSGLADLERSGVRFVNRQVGSGTRMLLELMLADAGLSPTRIGGFESAEFTHSAVAAYIASGMADVGFGVRTAAQRFGLEFIPLVRERYFLALPKAALDDPLIHQAVAIVQSPPFAEEVQGLSGYDASETGRIMSLEEAFG